MHIPQSMLHGNICPVTLSVSVIAVGSAIYMGRRSVEQLSINRFAGVSILILILQMLNFPIAHGISGHLIGGVLAASLLGMPLGAL